MRAWLARRRRWLSSAPRDLLVAIAVAITWGCWLANVVGRDTERSILDRTKQRMEMQCVRPPAGRLFSDI